MLNLCVVLYFVLFGCLGSWPGSREPAAALPERVLAFESMGAFVFFFTSGLRFVILCYQRSPARNTYNWFPYPVAGFERVCAFCKPVTMSLLLAACR